MERKRDIKPTLGPKVSEFFNVTTFEEVFLRSYNQYWILYPLFNSAVAWEEYDKLKTNHFRTFWQQNNSK